MIQNLPMILVAFQRNSKLCMKLLIITVIWDIRIRFNLDFMNIKVLKTIGQGRMMGILKLEKLCFSPFHAT